MQVIKELPKFAKDLDPAAKAGKELGLTNDDKTFYGALAAQTQKHEALMVHKKGLMQQLFPSPKEVAA